MSLADDSRLLQRYAKQYHAGAFSIPMAQELAEYDALGLIHRWDYPVGRTIAVESRSGRQTRRRGFTGEMHTFPPGTRVVTHLAVGAGCMTLPDLRQFDAVQVYVEDHETVRELAAQGFTCHETIITASSAIIGVYQQGLPTPYAPWDQATLTQLPLDVPPGLRAQVLVEVAGIHEFRDQEAYYHKGEWSQVTLRGFKPDDPFYDTKPSEMSRAWKQEHPADLALTTTDWTTLSRRTPALLQLINMVPGWPALERVRLLRLTKGQLTRHTDITDRSAGTSDGKIVRFHIPLVSHPDVRTHAWNLNGQQISQNWAPWTLWYLDQRKPHAVTNPSEVARVHLVVDVISNAEVRSQIARNHTRVVTRQPVM